MPVSTNERRSEILKNDDPNKSLRHTPPELTGQMLPPSESNPFTKKGFNLTKMLEISLGDPETAKVMRAAEALECLNPWLPGHMNFTAQCMIYQQSNEAAALLKSVAETYESELRADPTNGSDAMAKAVSRMFKIPERFLSVARSVHDRLYGHTSEKSEDTITLKF